jgi:hypothetical protein
VGHRRGEHARRDAHHPGLDLGDAGALQREQLEALDVRPGARLDLEHGGERVWLRRRDSREAGGEHEDQGGAAASSHRVHLARRF